MSNTRTISQVKQGPTEKRPQSDGRAAFTLIELLVVIAVIAILAALIFPVTGAVNRAKIRSKARAELAQVEAAIESYKAKMGFYPPSDTNYFVPNSLYYELMGVTFDGTTYRTKEGPSIEASKVPTTFGPNVGGIMNCTRGGGDEGHVAVQFLKGLKAGQSLSVTNPTCTVLGTTLEGPWAYKNTSDTKINPWRYMSVTPVHNPNSFDLWIDVKIGDRFFRFNNWSSEPEIITDWARYWP